jgi:hypothetical protein
MTAREDEVRRRIAHVVAMLQPTTLTMTPVDWRELWLTCTLAIHDWKRRSGSFANKYRGTIA